VPDCIRSLQKNQPIPVRNKAATRPWQHVLEPLSGYLLLAARLAGGAPPDARLCSAFNFGPEHDSNRTVAELVEEVLKHWPGRWEDCSNPSAVHEAGLLQLATDKAHALLRWSPVWSFAEAVRETVAWYHATWQDSRVSDPRTLTRAQIAHYVAQMQKTPLPRAAGSVLAASPLTL
jgi:CDP-glucose 4,6-dehydratase